MMGDLLTTGQAARELGISAGRMRQFVTEGRIPVTRTGPYNLIDRDDLEALRQRRPGRPETTGAGKRRKDRRPAAPREEARDGDA
jgi:excisionase family DNA binding protein